MMMIKVVWDVMLCQMVHSHQHVRDIMLCQLVKSPACQGYDAV